MFTGIIQGTAKIIAIDKKNGLHTHKVLLPETLLPGLKLGASVAHNGCCLTVTKLEANVASFDLMKATLDLTNLGLLKVGDIINVERATKVGDDIGGHAMSGHIMCMASITKIIKIENNQQIWFSLPQKHTKYIFEKGYIGIDGISLTIGDVDANKFSVNLIPETLTRTIIGTSNIGDKINIEIDPQTQAIVDTVERVMQNNSTK